MPLEHGESPVVEQPLGLSQVVERNIQALVARRKEEDRRRALQDRIADSITAFTGSMPFVYLHLGIFGSWVVINLGWLGIEPFDPSFVVLAMVASVEAIFLSTFVLISQNRMARLADQRADLDLQISLLAEHELTGLIRLVREIAKRLDVTEARSPEINELTKDVAPERVMDRLDEAE